MRAGGSKPQMCAFLITGITGKKCLQSGQEEDEDYILRAWEVLY